MQKALRQIQQCQHLKKMGVIVLLSLLTYADLKGDRYLKFQPESVLIAWPARSYKAVLPVAQIPMQHPTAHTCFKHLSSLVLKKVFELNIRVCKENEEEFFHLLMM